MYQGNPIETKGENRNAGGILNRRDALRVITGGTGSTVVLSVIPVSAFAAIPQMPDWMNSLLYERLGRTEFQEGRIELNLPDRADTGLSVPFEVSVPGSPMTKEDHVRSLHIYSTRNPQPLVSDYYFTPLSGIAKVSQRIRLAQSQYVYGFAIMSDGTAWMTARHVSVSLGACAVEIFLPDAEQARRRRQR